MTRKAREKTIEALRSQGFSFQDANKLVAPIHQKNIHRTVTATRLLAMRKIIKQWHYHRGGSLSIQMDREQRRDAVIAAKEKFHEEHE